MDVRNDNLIVRCFIAAKKAGGNDLGAYITTERADQTSIVVLHLLAEGYVRFMLYVLIVLFQKRK